MGCMVAGRAGQPGDHGVPRRGGIGDGVIGVVGGGSGQGGVPGDGGVAGLWAKRGTAGGGAPGAGLAPAAGGALGELKGELRATYRELRVQALPADLGADEGLQRVARDTADALRRHHSGARLQRLLLVNNAA
ncbi:hypothetical protein JRQ81_000595 [Phrynocephalus forsythii]|uniref:Uncharacterized protein n=1 Tax=Phrynocephalus forsythii TaxID=171643 RepID=A0A9Q0Y5K5_9SAUR|nr:hypothetical protein JRQ81_000595 [Phrynocephalus forsythii]